MDLLCSLDIEIIVYDILNVLIDGCNNGDVYVSDDRPVELSIRDVEKILLDDSRAISTRRSYDVNIYVQICLSIASETV
jgi:hypothetical protein